jgi:3-oxoacyl-[acyl-carrier protein] reductase
MSRACQKYMVDAEVGPRRQPLVDLGARQPRPANYSAAKAGMQGLTKTLAIETRPVRRHRQRDRARLHRHRHDRGHRGARWASTSSLQGGAAAQIPVRRVGQPEDIAHTVSFLVSEGAGFVSGQVIYVAAGP